MQKTTSLRLMNAVRASALQGLKPPSWRLGTPERKLQPPDILQSPRRLPSLTRIFLALAAVLCLALPGFADVQVFEQTYPLAPGGQFVLQNVNG
ncbi:MAG: hypothetical protein WA581_02785, partial [Candidatus Acidiferrales bacterium]